MLSIRGQRWIRCRTWPQRKAFMMLGSEHHVLRASVVEYLCPGIRIPLLRLFVEDRSEVVVVVVRAVVLTMVGLCRRTIDSHGVQIPFGIWIVFDVVQRREIVGRMYERRPSRHGVQAPVNED